MFGKSQNPGADKNLRTRYLIIGIAVVAILSLSTLSVLFYRQAQDYHDAKYRAQYVIISEMRQHMSWAVSYIDYMTQTGDSLVRRAIAGMVAVGQLEDLSGLVWAIQEMYLTDSEKNDTFSTLRHAVDVLRSYSWDVFDHMQSNLTLDDPREENLTLNAEIRTAGALLASLLPIIDEGFDYGVDFEKHPYSIVGRLDLQAIKSTAISIVNSF